MKLPESIRITEVGPRDGLQNEGAVIPVQQKVAFINALSVSGVAEIEVSSFVSPQWVPQLADAAAVFDSIERRQGVVYSALVPNETGMTAALEAGVDKIAIFAAASNSFSERNTNATIAQTLERFRPVIQQAKAAELPIRAYISCVVACPYEGPIKPSQVRDVAAALLELGADELDLGETIGVAAPDDIERLYDGLADLIDPAQTTLHLHDTRGTALVCAHRAMQLGVRSFDSACGGLGGCPYAPGAAGNLATEDLVYFCQRMGVETSVDMSRLFEAGRQARASLGRSLPGRVFGADGGGVA